MAKLVTETPYRWRIDPRDGMRVPGIVYSAPELLPDPAADKSLDQVANVATLPGIVAASYAMPDVHWGYGFPIGGVAATAIDDGGVVSPGGVGFDISCGVRLLASGMRVADLRPKLDALLDALDAQIPRGMRSGAVWQLRDRREIDKILDGGARYVVDRVHGDPGDLEYCEDRGVLDGADLSKVSQRARERGLGQAGSLGSGNHFLEVQEVEEIRDEPIARAYGLWPGQACVMIHTGSRGLGHQVCSDHVAAMGPAMDRYGIVVPDDQLACAPVSSPEGQAYLGALAAAANYGRANRQLLGQAARQAFGRAAGDGDLRLVYDVSHNLAKIETHAVDGQERRLCVHRKGATPGAAAGPSGPA